MGKARGVIKLVAVMLVAVLAWGMAPAALANSDVAQSENAPAQAGASQSTLVAQEPALASDSEEAFASLEGFGTQADPYKLASADDYATLHAAVNDNGENCSGLFFQQTSDIELPIIESGQWTPIGVGSSRFRGTLDGGGYTITVPEGSRPLFGFVQNATIKNLNIYGKRIEGCGLIDNMSGYGKDSDGNDYSGTAVLVDNVTIKSGTSILKSGILNCMLTSAYAGTAASYVSTIQNCEIEEGVVIGYDGSQSKIGSIAGRFNGAIEHCTSAATVKGQDFVGGIVGSRDNAMGTYEITHCSFSGTVQAEGEYVGGIAGGNYDNSTAPNGKKPTIENCSVSGSVAGGDKVGGILGGDRFGMQAWSDARIANNSVSGDLSGLTVGGIVGYYANLNKHDIFQNNCFKNGCGASSGFGEVVSVDTRDAAYPSTADTPYGKDEATGAYYYRTDGSTQAHRETADAAIMAILDIPASGYKAITHENESRSDDPLGVDADALVYSNDTGEREDTCESLRVSGSYKTDYVIGDTFSTDGMIIVGTWTDGTEQQVAPDECVITGFNSTKPGVQTITITYEEATAKIQVIVSNGAASAFNANMSGTVYLSVSDEARYRVSDGPVSGRVMWYAPIKIADVAKWANTSAYEALGLQKYANLAPKGAAYRYELTVLQLFTYANEYYSSVGAAGLEFSGAAGSSFMKNGFFGHDDNLNYYVDGYCPTDTSGATGVTSERIALKNGMYVDVAMFSDRAFFEDPLAGYRYFLGSLGAPIHTATAAVGAASAFKLTRVYEFTDGYEPETGATVYWGTESDWQTWASKGSAPTSNVSGVAKTKADGTANITFTKAGTYYVWTAGSKGEAGGEHANSIVSTPGALKVTVSKASNPLIANAKEKSKIPAATYGTAKKIAAVDAFEVSKAQGSVSYKKVSGNEKIAVANDGAITVQKGIAAGTYKMKVAVTAAGNDSYKPGTVTVPVTLTVSKAANPVKVKYKAKSVKLADVKKKAIAIAPLSVSKAQGKKAFKLSAWVKGKAEGKKYIKVNTKNGKITLKKGTSKGTYKFKVKVTAKGNGNYKAKNVVKTVTVKVK